MSPEFLSKWEHILEDIDKNKIPIEFIAKIVIKMVGKKQRTVNVKNLLKQGLETEQIEEALGKIFEELDEFITTVDFILNVGTIAETVQPTTDHLLRDLGV